MINLNHIFRCRLVLITLGQMQIIVNKFNST